MLIDELGHPQASPRPESRRRAGSGVDEDGLRVWTSSKKVRAVSGPIVAFTDSVGPADICC